MKATGTVFMKIIGHVGHGPNDRETSQIWIEYIKPIGQMSDEPWKIFSYTAGTQSEDWVPVNEIYWHPIWRLSTSKWNLLAPNLMIEYQLMKFTGTQSMLAPNLLAPNLLAPNLRIGYQ